MLNSKLPNQPNQTLIQQHYLTCLKPIIKINLKNTIKPNLWKLTKKELTFTEQSRTLKTPKLRQEKKINPKRWECRQIILDSACMQRNLNRANFPLIFLSFVPFSQRPNTNQDQKKKKNQFQALHFPLFSITFSAMKHKPRQ